MDIQPSEISKILKEEMHKNGEMEIEKWY